MLVDAHCHAHALQEAELKEHEANMTIISVSEDLESSLKSLDLGERFSNILPFVGVHPWSIGEVARSEVEEVMKLIEKRDDVRGIGEVGLDKKIRRTYAAQREVFERFCKLASEYDLPINVHAREAWREALELLRRLDIESAIIHWYSGPLELLEEIEASGYMITINPAAKIQPKHRSVLENAPLRIILTESDGPYEYRGMKLKPSLIPGLVKLIAEVKGLAREEVEEAVELNLKRLLG